MRSTLNTNAKHAFIQPECTTKSGTNGSKGIKNKNLKKINKKHLIEISLIQAKKTNIFSNIIVSSDSNKILDVSKKYNVILHKRSKKLSSDKSPKIPVIRDALKFAEKKT